MPAVEWLPKTKEQADQLTALVGQFSDKIYDNLMDDPDISPRDKSIMEFTKKGVPMYEILGVSQKQLDALLIFAHECIRNGILGKAKDALTMLSYLDIRNTDAIYGLGVVAQMEGDMQLAADLYFQFTSFNAMNPDGYLRLGECLLALKDYDDAACYFRCALKIAAPEKDGTGGNPRAHAHAQRMIDIMAESAKHK